MTIQPTQILLNSETGSQITLFVNTRNRDLPVTITNADGDGFTINSDEVSDLIAALTQLADL